MTIGRLSISAGHVPGLGTCRKIEPAQADFVHVFYVLPNGLKKEE
jgi:hypothetical protein